jgi:chromosome segregation ATPase
MQALYENVRTDRNVYSKNLLESQDEIMEMKRKLKIMNHQVEQLKEEIASRETVLVKEHFEHAKLEKEKEGLLLQIAKLQQQYDESHQMIQNQKCEEEKLRHIIAEADHERIRQKKEYEVVVQERDILGTQLIRRNDELSLLYEKIKIQTSTLNKGEIQYRERLEDIRVLRLEIKKLRREKAMLQTETQNVDSLRNEIFKLQRDILRERTRVKVLEEELESPMNIHRWRKLAGSDPSTYELISKIQTLQKRLIAKTEEVVEKELIIQQKDKLYQDIKKVLQRQPGPEIMEELQTVRTAVKAKVRESKVLYTHLGSCFRIKHVSLPSYRI